MTFMARGRPCDAPHAKGGRCSRAAVTRLMLGGARSWTWVCESCERYELARRASERRCERYPGGVRCRAPATHHVIGPGSQRYWSCIACLSTDRAAARGGAPELALAVPDEHPITAAIEAEIERRACVAAELLARAPECAEAIAHQLLVAEVARARTAGLSAAYEVARAVARMETDDDARGVDDAG